MWVRGSLLCKDDVKSLGQGRFTERADQKAIFKYSGKNAVPREKGDAAGGGLASPRQKSGPGQTEW